MDIVDRELKDSTVEPTFIPGAENLDDSLKPGAKSVDKEEVARDDFLVLQTPMEYLWKMKEPLLQAKMKKWLCRNRS